MTALTYEVKDPQSPVARWLRATFPHHKDIQSTYRLAAGPAQVLPSQKVAAGTQGAAIDWWLRMVIDRSPSLELALKGLIRGRVPCLSAGLELLIGLGGLDRKGKPKPMNPAEFEDRSDEWWARVCYALALLVELLRAARVEGSRLMLLTAASRPADLLRLANDDEVTDLIALRDLARSRLLPALPPGPVVSGPTFDGSADIAADADLIAGGVLIDFKASQGGRPRADGTRSASLAREELDQLLGYALMDYSDEYALHTVAIYAARFGHYAAWPLDELCTQLAGRAVNLAQLRREFAHVLRVDLPAYQEAAGQPQPTSYGDRKQPA